tara:strand:- start:18 stop:257 length:240 start_codon:yes stop_codon:yes gene_type:complete
MKIETVIIVNGIVASTSCTATMDDPCCDHAANFTSEGGEIGDLNDTVYGELSDAWESRDDGDESVTIGVDGDEITLSLV